MIKREITDKSFWRHYTSNYFGNVCVTNTNCEQQIPPMAGFCFIYGCSNSAYWSWSAAYYWSLQDCQLVRIFRIFPPGVWRLPTCCYMRMILYLFPQTFQIIWISICLYDLLSSFAFVALARDFVVFNPARLKIGRWYSSLSPPNQLYPMHMIHSQISCLINGFVMRTRCRMWE